MKFKIIGIYSTGTSLAATLNTLTGKKFDEITSFAREGDTDHIEFCKGYLKFTDSGARLQYGWFIVEAWIFENGRMFTACGGCKDDAYIKQIKDGLAKIANPDTLKFTKPHKEG